MITGRYQYIVLAEVVFSVAEIRELLERADQILKEHPSHDPKGRKRNASAAKGLLDSLRKYDRLEVPSEIEVSSSPCELNEEEIEMLRDVAIYESDIYNSLSSLLVALGQENRRANNMIEV